MVCPVLCSHLATLGMHCTHPCISGTILPIKLLLPAFGVLIRTTICIAVTFIASDIFNAPLGGRLQRYGLLFCLDVGQVVLS